MSTEPTSTLRDRILATSDNSPSLLDSAGPSLLQHLQRDALRPLADEVRRWHKEVTEPLLRATSQLSVTSDALRSAFISANEEGRRDLARLQKTAHRLTHSRARLSFRLLEFLESLNASNRTHTAHLAGRAFLGDEQARKYWHEQASTGDETALVVVSLLEDLDSFAAEVPLFIADAAHTITETALAVLDLDTTGDAPPPDVILCGSVSRNAP